MLIAVNMDLKINLTRSIRPDVDLFEGEDDNVNYDFSKRPE